MGTAVYGGYIDDNETRSEVKGTERYKTYSDILANVSIVSAGVRYFLNLVAKSNWTAAPAEADTDGKFAEMCEQALFEDPLTPWHRIVRRGAMYRFYGFSVQEWTMKRATGENDFITYADISPRAQKTIEKWDVDEQGTVFGVVQTSVQDGKEIYLPRQKLVYLVDDTLSDSPEGLGLFRHLVQPAKRLARYEELEGYGFETDLRGIPVGRGPFDELKQKVDDGEITAADRIRLESGLRTFIKNHIRGPKLGLLLDSSPYLSQDDVARPSQTNKWSLELLKGTSTSFVNNAEAIARLNNELARILGVEGLMLGANGKGSLALSKEKAHQLYMVIDNSLKELTASFDNDLVKPLWAMNGWPEEMRPRLKAESVQFKDIEQVTNALLDMANAGAPLASSDPVIGEVRDLLGLERPVQNEDGSFDIMDAALTSDDVVGRERRTAVEEDGDEGDTDNLNEEDT